MSAIRPGFRVKLADTPEERIAAQRLRYEVFVSELGGGGEGVDHNARIEADHFDTLCDHLILIDEAEFGAVVGVYRLLGGAGADAAGGFYSQGEYDLAPLRNSGQKLLELGRSCLHRNYRGGEAMFHLWQGLADYVTRQDIDLMFGVASFHGTDAQVYDHALSFLHHRHRAPERIAPRAHSNGFQAMDLLTETQTDRKRAMRMMPALIKAYLRLGGLVGEGAYIDRAFNTIDVCLLLETRALNARQKQIYARRRTP